MELLTATKFEMAISLNMSGEPISMDVILPGPGGTLTPSSKAIPF